MKINYLLITFIACILSILISNSYAESDPWLDEVIQFEQPTGSSNNGGVPQDALGPTNRTYVSIDIPETLIVAFTNNIAFDGTGNDIAIYEVSNGDCLVDISASKDNITYIYLGRTSGNVNYDLADYNLDYIKYLKFEGLSDNNIPEGYDLDAAKALNSKEVEGIFSGCFKYKKNPFTDGSVMLIQTGEFHQKVSLDSNGCFSFYKLNEELPFSVLVRKPQE